MTAASCKKIACRISSCGLVVELQIVLIRLFAATDGYPISVENEFFFYYYYFYKCNRTIGSIGA